MKLFVALSGAFGIDVLGLRAGQTIRAETRAGRSIPRQNRIYQRPRSLGSPLQAVQFVSAKHVLDGVAPEADVFGMIPAGNAGRMAVIIDRYDLGIVRDGVAAIDTLQYPGVELHSALAGRFEDFLENIMVGIVERRIHDLVSQRRVLECGVMVLDPDIREP